MMLTLDATDIRKYVLKGLISEGVCKSKTSYLIGWELRGSYHNPKLEMTVELDDRKDKK